MGLIEDADDDYDALNDNLNAAGTYVHALQVGDTTRNVIVFLTTLMNQKIEIEHLWFI